MQSSDPIADCFTRLRNGAKARSEQVTVPYSALKEKILGLLKSEGYISDIEIEEGPKKKKSLVARLRYEKGGVALLTHIKRISKPGHRVYQSAPDDTLVRSGLGFRIYSTSKGILTDRQAAEKKTGGEVLGEVW